MQKDNFISKQYLNKIYHPLLLTDFDIFHSNPKSSIIPELKNKKELSDTIDEFIIYKNNNDKLDLKSFTDINQIFQSDDYFLLSHFNISKIENIYSMLQLLVHENNHINTISDIMNKVFSVFKNDFDDINIDKIVYIYIDFFKIYYEENIIYSKIFSNIKNILDDKETDINIIHTIIIRYIIINK